MLLLVLGLRYYSLIRGLVSPTKPENKTLAHLMDILRKHCDPEPIVIAERFHFYQRTQKSGKSGKSKKTSQPVQVWSFPFEGIERPTCLWAQQRGYPEILASQGKPHLGHCHGDSLGHGSSRQEDERAQGEPAFYPHLQSREDITAPAKTCGRCGHGNHSSSDGKLKDATCHKCGKVGHYCTCV